MPITITLPENPESIGNTGHTTDHNTIVTALTTLGAQAVSGNLVTAKGDTIYASAASTLVRLPIGTTGQILTVVSGAPAWQSGSASTPYNVTASGDTTGAADYAAINSITSASGGSARLGPGTFYVNQELVLALGAGIAGVGEGVTILSTNTTGTAFSAGVLIDISGAGFNRVSSLSIQDGNGSYSSGHPAFNAIAAAHSNSSIVRDVGINYVNGWAVQVISDATSDSYNTTLDNVHSFQCAQGCQLIGTNSTDHQENTQLIGCNFDQCQNSDALQIIDTHDVQIWGLKGTCTAGTGICLNILGASAGIHMSDVDLGPSPSFSQPCIHIGASGGNSPDDISIKGGDAEGCEPNLSITDASSNITIFGLTFLNAGTNGASVSGTASEISIVSCQFTGSGVVAGTNYDLVWSSSGNGLIRGNWFNTPQGTGSGQVTSAVNPSAGTVIVDGNYVNGAPLFSPNFPKKASNNIGYNPVGHVTSPSLPGTTVALTNPFGSDAYVYVTPAAVNTTVAIGGVTVNTLTGGGAPGYYVIPWNQSITLTYASGTPVWTWFLS